MPCLSAAQAVLPTITLLQCIDGNTSAGLITACAIHTTYRVEKYDGDVIIHLEGQSGKQNIMDLPEGHLEEGQVLVSLQENEWRHRIETKAMSKNSSYPIFATIQGCLYDFRGVNQQGNLFFAIYLDNRETTVVYAFEEQTGDLKQNRTGTSAVETSPRTSFSVNESTLVSLSLLSVVPSSDIFLLHADARSNRILMFSNARKI